VNKIIVTVVVRDDIDRGALRDVATHVQACMKGCIADLVCRHIVTEHELLLAPFTLCIDNKQLDEDTTRCFGGRINKKKKTKAKP
jgi:hypothetical protein